MHPQDYYLQHHPPQTILLDQPDAGYPASMRAPYPPRSTLPAQNSNRWTSSGGGFIIQDTISSAMSRLQEPRTNGLLRNTVMSGRKVSGSITHPIPIIVSKDGVYEIYYAKGAPPPRLPDPRMFSTSACQQDP